MTITWLSLFWLFFFYSFIGWCIEVCAAAVQHRKFVNRGFVTLPVVSNLWFRRYVVRDLPAGADRGSVLPVPRRICHGIVAGIFHRNVSGKGL